MKKSKPSVQDQKRQRILHFFKHPKKEIVNICARIIIQLSSILMMKIADLYPNMKNKITKPSTSVIKC